MPNRVNRLELNRGQASVQGATVPHPGHDSVPINDMLMKQALERMALNELKSKVPVVKTRLKEYRRRLIEMYRSVCGFTQDTLSRASNVTQAQLSNIETGKTKETNDATLIKLCDKLERDLPTFYDDVRILAEFDRLTGHDEKQMELLIEEAKKVLKELRDRRKKTKINA